jgi:hypothetical protein
VGLEKGTDRWIGIGINPNPHLFGGPGETRIQGTAMGYEKESLTHLGYADAGRIQHPVCDLVAVAVKEVV